MIYLVRRSKTCWEAGGSQPFEMHILLLGRDLWYLDGIPLTIADIRGENIA